MRIIEPSFKIISKQEFPLMLLELAGRTCYKSKSDLTTESAKDFCRKIIRRGHESVIEHGFVTVKIICDRGVSHEIVRHRLASYSQESTRYCNYGKDEHITFIKPCFFEGIDCREYHANERFLVHPTKEKTWLHCVADAELHYNQLIEKGCAPQEARSVLPNSLKTEIVMTANFREWRHFFKLRTASGAHPQMREIAKPMLREFQKIIPVIYDDIDCPF